MTGARVRPGDLVVGLAAYGFHSNGYTLIRSVLRRRPVRFGSPRPGSNRPLGEELLEPTRSYVAASEAVAGLSTVHAFVHISGGGVRNLVRIHPGVRFLLDAWPTPAGIYRWLAERGSIPLHRLYETFNMGVGFVCVIDPQGWPRVRTRLRRAGYGEAQILGRVASGSGVEIPHLRLRYQGYA